MKPICLLLAIFISGVGLVGCKNESVVEGTPPQYNPPQDIRAIVPLAINQEMRYNLIFAYMGVEETTLVTRRILDTITVDSIRWYRMDGSFQLIRDSPLLRADSVNFIDYTCYFCLRPTDAEATGWRPFYLLTLPIVKGHEWKLAPWDSTGQEHFGTLRITTADTSVSVSGRTYQHAIVVEYVDSFGKYVVFVPGVGIVKEFYGQGIDSSSRLELVGYD
jgi:hypothetical protein